VGKTTTAAALALALAQAGHTALIVTIDPARRLAGALGVPMSDAVSSVTLPEAGGRLFALMPDPRRSLRTFVERLFAHEPAAKARVLKSGIFRGFADAAAGVHELVAMNLVAHAAQGGAFEAIVIDTAPSRHAIDFVTYPGRLTSLLSGRAVSWLASFARSHEEPSPDADRPPSGLVARGAGFVERIVARVTGPWLARETAAIFADLARVRERFVSLTERATGLLLGSGATYLLVAAPTHAAGEDVRYLAERLAKLGHAPRAILMNRADTCPAPYVEQLRAAPRLPASILAALETLETERTRRAAAAERLAADFRARLPGVQQVRLSQVEAAAPEAIVMALAEELGPHLQTLLPLLERR